MYKKGQPLRVSNCAPYHAGKIGEFEFAAGRDYDVIVMCTERIGSIDTLIAVNRLYVEPVDADCVVAATHSWKVYVLMECDFGGMFTSPFMPIGKAVTDEEKAKAWVDGRSDRQYYEVEVE